MMQRKAGDIVYSLIHSTSSSKVSIHVEDKGVRVYAPRQARLREVDRIVLEARDWILKEQERLKPSVSREDKASLSQQAKDRICERIECFAPMLGNARPNRITIREQKTRWGSCSRKGNLNFNWKLIKAPGEALDYVVIHELCHLYEFNHSPRFWQMVAKIQPDYKVWKAWLAQYAQKL